MPSEAIHRVVGAFLRRIASPRAPKTAKRTLKDYRTFCDVLAEHYDELPDVQEDQKWRWEKLADHIEKFYDRMQSRVNVEYVDGQPYEDADEMERKVKESGVLQISKDFNEHPVFTPEQNLKFRAVHDYIVHIMNADKGIDFSREGEIKAYNLHRKLAPPDTWPALFTEVAAQACYANSRGEFPDQKVAIMPMFDPENVGNWADGTPVVPEQAKKDKKSDKWSAAAVLVENDKGEVLLLKRGPTAPWMPGKWNLPGGTVDSGETPEQTAIRETQEETGLEISNLKPLSKKTFSADGQQGTAHFFTTQQFKGDLDVTWENSEAQWVPKEKALEFDLVPGIKDALRSSLSAADPRRPRDRGLSMDQRGQLWKQFIVEEVPNPNPKSRDQFPQVQRKTLFNHGGADRQRVLREWRQVLQRHESPAS